MFGLEWRRPIFVGETPWAEYNRDPALPPMTASSMNDSGRLEEEVLAVLSDYLGRPASELKPEKSLEELGADSLDFAEILFEIEEKFDIKSPLDLPELRAQIRSVGDVLRLTADLVAAKNA